MSIEPVMPSNHLILCHPLLLQPSVFPRIRVFSNESALRIRWPKYWSFSICPSNAYSGLISFRTDWFFSLLSKGQQESSCSRRVLRVLLKSLLQHHDLKASIFWHSAFFVVQLSHLYMTTGKPMAILSFFNL